MCVVPEVVLHNKCHLVLKLVLLGPGLDTNDKEIGPSDRVASINTIISLSFSLLRPLLFSQKGLT
jgi:hypothetical protein